MSPEVLVRLGDTVVVVNVRRSDTWTRISSLHAPILALGEHTVCNPPSRSAGTLLVETHQVLAVHSSSSL